MTDGSTITERLTAFGPLAAQKKQEYKNTRYSVIHIASGLVVGTWDTLKEAKIVMYRLYCKYGNSLYGSVKEMDLKPLANTVAILLQNPYAEI